MNITELKNKLNSLNLLKQFPDIHGYAISFKEVEGVRTDNICVTFYVENKKPISELLPEQILPTTLSDFDIEIVTDVVQRAKVNFTAINNIYPDEEEWDTKYANRFKYRPIIGGISSICHTSTDATLGLLVRDTTDRSVVALSNNHVYSASQTFGGVGKFKNTLSLSAIQPGLTDERNNIGIHKRCVPFDTKNSNKVDCAIVQLDNYNLIHPLSTQVFGFKDTGPYQFATTEEIDSLMEPTSPNFKAPIFRSGRSFGPMGYPGNACNNFKTAVSAVTIPTKLPIQNIKSIKYTYEPDDNINSNIFDYGGPQGLIIQTTDDEIYRSGYLNNVPNQHHTSMHLQKIGNFSYFDYSLCATYGISANKLVFFAEEKSIGNNWKSQNAVTDTTYTIAPEQLSNYTNVSKIILSEGGSFILSGESIYSIGVNDYFHTMGYGGYLTPSSTPSWVRIPGNWKDILEVDVGEFVALSTSGELFYTSGISRRGGFKYIDYFTNITNVHNLTANKISNLKFKKIYSTGNWLSGYNTFNGLALSASGGRLFSIGLNSQGNFATRAVAGTWGDDIKPVENNIYRAGFQSKLLLSGTDVYNMGLSLNPERISRFSTFFNRSSSYPASRIGTNFCKISGVSVNYITGWGYSDIFRQKQSRSQESIIFLSGGVWYCAGLNPLNIFDIHDESLKKANDSIIVTDLYYTTSVGPYDGDVTIAFEDCLTIQALNKNFDTTTGGDSGTAVFALLSSNIPSLSAWKLIGLIFAGSQDDKPYGEAVGIVCRIDNIQNQLKIESWDGTIPTTKSKIQNTTISVDYDEEDYTFSAYLSGRNFYNIGIV